MAEAEQGVITCKAAVCFEAKKPFEVIDVRV